MLPFIRRGLGSAHRWGWVWGLGLGLGLELLAAAVGCCCVLLPFAAAISLYLHCTLRRGYINLSTAYIGWLMLAVSGGLLRGAGWVT